jgi:hypothetical protein
LYKLLAFDFWGVEDFEFDLVGLPFLFEQVLVIGEAGI